MPLKLIADVHISPTTVSELQKSGYEIFRITDFIPADSSDLKIIELALEKNSSIVTQDLDFSALIAKSGMNKPSVVCLRVGNASPEQISMILKAVLPMIEAFLEDGAIVSVDDKEYRVRKLPIH